MQKLQALQEYVFFNFGGKPLVPMRHIINLYKGSTLFYVLALMIYYQNYSTSLVLYACLHGSYGFLWLFKDFFFGDKTFTREAAIGSILLVNVVLLLYWVTPFLIVIGQGINSPSWSRMITSISMYLSGAVLMMGSDFQKNTILKKQRRLIKEGFFKLTRNPNYLGQMLIYGSFAVVGGHQYSYYILALVWSTLFLLNIILKEKSYRAKKGWEIYREQSGILLPRLGQWWIEASIYGSVGVAAWQIYNSM